MKKLSNRNADLLSEGCRTLGSYSEGLFYVEEQLYLKDIKTLQAFCEWVDNYVGGASRHNSQRLFECFIAPEVPANKAYVTELKDYFANRGY